ncbi:MULTISPECIES: hypothetical protein [unclassified Stenotrophomonas]|uniref:hypothetical protein n=1 Tax=unclassified Stenotrophomonas TaxID=196198 RepID=UPI000D156EF3|nr:MULTISPECIES: hypothetical protein [unclassified Stenotrophomonas]PTA70184.1 hypothetical protein C9412_19510 [Stenotrophomonas sp. Nf1]PTA75975.1 hypothetical protein C9416_18295 [Stenotrophomonas sp. Nf4]
MIRRLPVLALLAVPALATAASNPHDVASRFYAALQNSGPDQALIGPLLGDALRAAIDAQRGYEQACTALAAPDEKPHMLDQSPYLMAPDRPETVKVGLPGAGGEATWMPVEMAIGDYRWTDRVLLQRQGQDWKVMDIRWGQGGSLIGRLKDFSAFRCTATHG